MAKKRQENQTEETPAAKPAASTKTVKKKVVKKRVAGELPWHPFWRWLVSLLVVLHLTAVFVAPWDLMTDPALPPGYMPPRDARGRPQPLPPLNSMVWQKPVVTRGLHRFFHDYLNLLYLNHGYEFFAPDPPPGTHLVDYQVTQADGNVVKGRFPSLDEQWPRLRYHRHMMLTEQTQLMGPQSRQQYADHLASLHGGPSRLELKVHLVLPPHRVADKTPLDAPSTFRTIGIVNGRPRPKASAALPAPKQQQQQRQPQQGGQQ